MKKILLFAFLLCSFSAFAQYPATPTTKQELGRQTTGDGLIYRGSGAPAYTPSNNRNAWIYYDTTNNRLYKSRLGSWSLMVQDTSAFNEIQMPYIVDDTLYLTGNVTGEPLTAYVNRVWPIAALSDTASITGENQGDVAFVTGGTAVAFRGSAYWNPFTGGGGGGTFNSFNIAGDTGSDIVTDGQTVTVAGGYGINTAEAGGTVTVTADTTQLVTPSDIAGLTPITASNGLTKVTNDIKLGGTLTGATTITGASQDLTETGLKYYQFEADSAIWRINGEKFLHMGSLKGASYNYDEVAIGYRAGANLPSYNSTANTLIGAYAGAALNGTAALGASNWMAGYTAGQLIETGSYNTITGVAAMAGTSTAISFSGAYGHHAMRLATGNYNYGFGNNALENITGTGNFGAGQNALRAGLSANYNTGAGHQVMENLTTGDYNTGTGSDALRLITTGSQNTGAGASSLYSNQTGSGNIGLGYNAGYSETGSNKLYIDNSNTSSPLIGGDLSGNFVGINQSISSLAYVLDINSTGAMRFPIGTTAQRPTTATGIFRVNSDSTRFEWYTGSAWKSFAHVGDSGGGGTVTGTGTTNRVAKFTGTSSIGNGTMSDDGTTVSMDDGSTGIAKPFRFDSWTTAAQPTGVVGIAGNNTTNNNFDFYTGSSWENFAKHTNASGLGASTYVPFYDSNGRLGAGNAGLSFITTSYPYLQYGQSTTLTDNALYYWINGNTSSRTFTNSSGATRSAETGAWRCVALFGGANRFENANGMAGTVLSNSGLAAGSTLRGGYFQSSNGSGAGLAAEVVGVRGDGSNASASGTTTIYGGRFAGANNAAGTVVTMNIVSSELGNNSGAITNTRGFFCGDISAGTQTNTPWSFYASDANANSAFNGKVHIGAVTTPTRTLNVTGEARITDLATDTPTRIVGADADGDLGEITATITTAGTTGNVTINALAGTVNIAVAGTTVTVTNSLVTANSLVFCTLRTNDTTATVKNVVPAAGSFVINLGAAATGEVSIGFFVVN
jgi:hypothetical protein